MSNELLQKVIDTTEVGAGGGGLLKPEQSNRFIDYMFDATILTRVARTIRMRSDTTEIDKVGVGEKLMVLATEGASTGQTDRGATFTKVSLTTKKLRLDWELSSESLEDNIEGADLEDHIARLMATQAGNDVEDLALNGDTALSSDNLYKAFNGFRKLALNGGQVVDAGGATISKATFNSALKAMPRKYKQRRNQLRFFTGSNLVQDYLYNLTTVGSTPEDIASSILRGNPAAPEGNPGGVIPFAFGIPVVEVPLIDETRTGTYSGATGQHGEVHLTFPQNFIVGIKRDVTVYREFKPKKDTIEYTLYIRVGVAIENLDSFVVVRNVKVAS
jgi:HK97 family phage major capsid protein